MQFGFTEGLSTNMAALILSEVCSNITAKDILFITTLDSQKAFDVVNHQILMDKLYHLGVNLPLHYMKTLHVRFGPYGYSMNIIIIISQ